MIIDVSKFKQAKYKDLIDLSCDNCLIHFKKIKKNSISKNIPSMKNFCSEECLKLFCTKRTRTDVKCLKCSKEFKKKNVEISRSKNNFCSYSCSASYNNAHKTKGTQRSKLEVWLEGKLSERYSDLNILYSDRTAIKSELDIYIPSLNLAFELNGIFHYEPIYGADKLLKTKNNDDRKFQACIENGIELCIIDTTSQKYFKESTSIKFLDIICRIIDIKRGRKEI